MPASEHAAASRERTKREPMLAPHKDQYSRTKCGKGSRKSHRAAHSRWKAGKRATCNASEYTIALNSKPSSVERYLAGRTGSCPYEACSGAWEASPACLEHLRV